MKKLLLILLCFPFIGFGQEDDLIIEDFDDNTRYVIVEQMPEFPCIDIKYNSYDENGEIIGYRTKEYCGEEGLMKYIANNVRYPQIAKEYGITGKVYVQFVVDKDGSVTDVKILRGVDKNLDAEALRVIRSLPKYKPGMQRGEPCKVIYTIPINFKLN